MGYLKISWATTIFHQVALLATMCFCLISTPAHVTSGSNDSGVASVETAALHPAESSTVRAFYSGGSGSLAGIQ